MSYLLIITGCVLLSEALTPEELIDCFEIVNVEYTNEEQFNETNGALNTTTAAKLIEQYPKEMDGLCDAADMVKSSGSSSSSPNQPESDPDACLSDPKMFCFSSSIPLTPGDDYLDIREDLRDDISGILLPKADELGYTDGNAVSKLFSDLEIADNVGNAFSVITGATGWLDKFPVFGAIFDVIDSAQQAGREATRKSLEKADLHDGILMTEHLSALIEDRKRIIANQQYLENKMIELFNLQNAWLEIKFNDLFSQLNTIDKLIRTPSGQRPDWNRQTGLDNLFVEPTDVQVPTIDDQDNSAS